MARTIQQFVDLKTDDPVTGSIEGDNELVARFITPHPFKSGRAQAYFPAYRREVAVVIRGLQDRNGDIQETARDWELADNAVLAAVAFYRQNRAVIDARHLVENDLWDPDFQSGG